MNTRRLVVEEGGFKYDSDSYADDLPYWNMEYGKPHLIIPYTLSENDMRFVSPSNFSTGEEFCKYLKETLQYLIMEGRAGSPKMMSIGLHCRLARPGRVQGLSDFLDFAKSYKKEVWFCTREQIADFWRDNHYPHGAGSPLRPGKAVSEDTWNPNIVDPVLAPSTEDEESGDVI
jgi:peptidoglycan/xylan/chitin deacetylase (PgdA/CDA1 family)